MAENPATWKTAERVIDKAITQARRADFAGIYGWSMAKQIAEALRKVELLRENCFNCERLEGAPSAPCRDCRDYDPAADA